MSTAELARARTTGDAAPIPGELHWVSHPLRQSPSKAALLVAVVAATALLIGIGTESGAWAAVSVAFLVLGVYDFVFPTRYRLTDWGVESTVLFWRRSRPWSMLVAAHRDAAGVLLSPFTERSFLEHYRGLYLRYAGNRRQVLDYVGPRLAGRSPLAGLGAP